MVQRKLLQFLSMQVHTWMEFQLLIFGIWLWFCFIATTTKLVKPRIHQHRDTCGIDDNSELFHIDSVPSNVEISQSIAMLSVFEDNEAMINMIIKGRSPTMRHVSRTHRVSLD